jgi:hypothetical protein
MKKTILTLVAAGLVAGAGLQSAKAHDDGWSVAGKVFTGIAAASVVAQAFAPPPTYYTYPAPPVAYSAPSYGAPAYAAPPTVYVAPPRPVIVYRPPVYAAPVYAAPAVSLNFRFGGGYHHYYHHGHW